MKFATLLTLAMIVPAVPLANAATSVTGIVTRLQTGLSAGVYIYMDQDYSQLNCTLGNNGLNITLVASHGQFREIYATLMAGLLSNRQMTVRIVEGSTNCSVMYVMLN